MLKFPAHGIVLPQSLEIRASFLFQEFLDFGQILMVSPGVVDLLDDLSKGVLAPILIDFDSRTGGAGNKGVGSQEDVTPK